MKGGSNANSPDRNVLGDWAANNSLALLFNPKNPESFLSNDWNTETNADLAFASVGADMQLPDRRVLTMLLADVVSKRCGSNPKRSDEALEISKRQT